MDFYLGPVDFHRIDDRADIGAAKLRSAINDVLAHQACEARDFFRRHAYLGAQFGESSFE
ncbi:hypothetical protein [Hyphomicrobium sp.]|uniref:hypothetical protein n=1 Tax=Hyphomicrobium sp. TaxID=82 RepID=UPI003F70F607